MASHLFDQMWLKKAQAALGNERGLAMVAADMRHEARIKGFLAWVRVIHSIGKAQGKTYGIGVLSARVIQQFQTALPAEQIGSPVVSFRGHLIAGQKATRHEAAGNAITDVKDYRKIIEEFGKPDYELWDVRNRHLLHVYDMGNEQAMKLSIEMNKDGAEVVSAFYVPMISVESAIKNVDYVPIE